MNALFLCERPDLTAVLDVTAPEPPAADSPFFRWRIAFSRRIWREAAGTRYIVWRTLWRRNAVAFWPVKRCGMK